jgi:hypothetical protein
MEQTTTSANYTFTIQCHEEGRFIVRVNGYEIDILADDDGLSAEIQRFEEDGNTIITSAETAWGGDHINA